MNQYITGSVIKELREKNALTQAQAAKALGVSDKAISKWETGKGYPDITLLEPLAALFHVSVAELLSGDTVSNMNTSSNMLRSKFCICPVCGNIIHCMGDAVIQCHGILLSPEEASPEDDMHKITYEMIEDEYYVRIDHEMTKNHYISFVSAVSSDSIQTVKLYPEGNADARLKAHGARRLYFYCNKDGLFYCDIRKTQRYCR